MSVVLERLDRLPLIWFLCAHACLCYPTPWRTYQQPMFLPGPQFCPDTGRTVCTSVDYYPTEQILHLLTKTRSQAFNLSSLFVDERRGDVEPNLDQLPSPPPPADTYGDNAWNPATDTPAHQPGYGVIQPGDNWRQVPQQQPRLPGVSRTPFQQGQQQRTRQQQLPNQRHSPGNGQQFNNGDHLEPGVGHNGEEPPGDFGYRTHNNNINPEPQQNGYGGQNQHQPYGTGNYSGYHREGPKETFQIQSPLPHHGGGVKGYAPQPVAKPTPHTNWKGSPHQHDNSRFNSGRQRRSEEAEVACRVRSTYVPPRAALSDRSEWKFIVNLPERDRRLTQVVRVDLCSNADQPCSSRISLPFGFESRCRQKYIKKKLLSLNADGQGTSEDNFFIPSCCVCELVRSAK